MNNLKAVVTGLLLIWGLMLIVQLLYLVLAVGMNSIMSALPWLQGLDQYLKYLLGVPILLGLMFMVGYVTALVADSNEVWLSLGVAVTGLGSLVLLALSNAQFTIWGVLFLVCAVGVAGLGARYKYKTTE